MRSLAVFLISAGLALGLTACGSEPAAPPAATPAAAAPAPKKAPAPVEDPTRGAVVGEAFAYAPEGLRDPFQPFIKLEEKKQSRPQVFVPKTPLQRYATEELQLVGIIWGEAGRARALIEDPEGKGYVVGTGTLVGDRGGRIVRIQPQEAVVEERAVDLFGEENVNVVRMTLRKPEGEVNP